MEKLYLFEVLVDKVVLETRTDPETEISFVCTATFGDVVSVDITPAKAKPPSTDAADDADTAKPEITDGTTKVFASGKSYLFSINPEALIGAMAEHTIHFKMSKSSGAEVGAANIEWDDSFTAMVAAADTNTKPVSKRVNLDLSVDGQKTATAKVFVRLSCFGSNIQTQFQKVAAAEGEGKRQYVFKSTTTPATFQLQKYGSGSSPPFPIASALLGTVSTFSGAKPMGSATIGPANVDCPEIPSIIERPEEKKHMNLLDLNSDADPRLREGPFTAANLREKLCNKAQCPGMRQFRDIGLDPFTTPVSAAHYTSPYSPGYTNPYTSPYISPCHESFPANQRYEVYSYPSGPPGPGGSASSSPCNCTSTAAPACNCGALFCGTDRLNAPTQCPAKGLIEELVEMLPERKLDLPVTNILTVNYCGGAACPFSQEVDKCGIESACMETVDPDECSVATCPYIVDNEPQLPCAMAEGYVPEPEEEKVDEAPPPPPPPPPDEGRKRRKKKDRFVYLMGPTATDPPLLHGHAECIPLEYRDMVPPGMGWNWTHLQKNGWKPGAVDRRVADIMMKFKSEKERRMAAFRKINYHTMADYNQRYFDNLKPKPMLHIRKKDGVYWITMNPLKDPFSIESNEDPYMDCTPMQFKITKKKEKKVEGECACDETESSDSELEIEFTPPAGIIVPEKMKMKPDIVHAHTQIEPKDIEDLVEKPAEGKAGKGKKKGSKKGSKKASRASTRSRPSTAKSKGKGRGKGGKGKKKK